MAESSLKQKAVTGVLWTSIQRFLSLFIQFVSGIVLARLLTPDDYGCIGMLSVFTLLAATIVDGGFSSALIQKKRPTEEDYSTIFYWNVGFSLFIYVILYAMAPSIAAFYGIDLLCPVLRVQGLIVIIGAFQTIQINMLNKQFRFKKISIVTLIASIISLAVTLVMAYSGFGVWALVAQNILALFIPTSIYWATSKWHPKLCFSVKSFKELFSFGVYMFLTSLMTTLVKNVQTLLIGRFYNASTLGFFSKAASTERLASTSISQVLGQVTYPLYAELQDDKAKLANTIKRITLLIAFTTFPIMLILMLVAKPLFTLLYSDRWLPSVFYFQVLCLTGIALSLHSVNGQAIAAIGKSKAMFTWSVIKQSAGMLFIVVGIYAWGMNGLLTGSVMGVWLVYFVNASLVSYYIGYRLWKQLLDLLPVTLVAVFAFGVAYVAGIFVEMHMYLIAMFQICIYAVVYLSVSHWVRLDAYVQFLDIAKPYIRKLK